MIRLEQWFPNFFSTLHVIRIFRMVPKVRKHLPIVNIWNILWCPGAPQCTLGNTGPENNISTKVKRVLKSVFRKIWCFNSIKYLSLMQKCKKRNLCNQKECQSAFPFLWLISSLITRSLNFPDYITNVTFKKMHKYAELK